MLKVLNRNPHFLREPVPVANYAEAWDVICSIQRELGRGILLVSREAWDELGLLECFPNFVWKEGVKAVYINSDKTLITPALAKYNRANVLKLIKFFEIHYSIREIDD